MWLIQTSLKTAASVASEPETGFFPLDKMERGKRGVARDQSGRDHWAIRKTTGTIIHLGSHGRIPSHQRHRVNPRPHFCATPRVTISMRVIGSES
jgi:hypothetical protein